MSVKVISVGITSYVTSNTICTVATVLPCHLLTIFKNVNGKYTEILKMY